MYLNNQDIIQLQISWVLKTLTMESRKKEDQGLQQTSLNLGKNVVGREEDGVVKRDWYLPAMSPR